MTLQKIESFVPLTTAGAAGNNREFQVTVIPQPKPGQTTTALERPAPAVIESSPLPLGNKKHCEPYMSMQRDGDRITGIRIQCSCGQVIDLACLYDESSRAK